MLTLFACSLNLYIYACAQDISPGEVSKSFGDRIRNAPAVVNAGRSKSSKQARPISGHAASAAAAAAASAANVGGNGRGGSGDGETDGAAGAQSAGTGLYEPRTSGRGVGGSLRKRFSDDQVGESA